MRSAWLLRTLGPFFCLCSSFFTRLIRMALTGGYFFFSPPFQSFYFLGPPNYAQSTSILRPRRTLSPPFSGFVRLFSHSFLFSDLEVITRGVSPLTPFGYRGNFSFFVRRTADAMRHCAHKSIGHQRPLLSFSFGVWPVSNPFFFDRLD